MTAFPRTARNKVGRLPERARYARDDVYDIVDATFLCHVGFVAGGEPVVLPTLHARDGDTVLLHGSSGARLLDHVAHGGSVCVTVTLVDGIVLARSIFNHSINYRSAVLFGRGRLVTADDEKMAALTRFTERLMPGRWDDARLPNRREMKATSIVAVAIESASAKVRTGPPKDEPEDLELPIWAGVLPLHQHLGDPVVDDAGRPGIEFPAYLDDFIAKARR